MSRARGANTILRCAFEDSYGTPPSSGLYGSVPFVSSQLGAERGLIESDLLGGGRDPYDPTPDVTNNDGDLVVPVDTQAIGMWLKLMFGAETMTGSSAPYTHVFNSSAASLPSMSLEFGQPEVPSFSTHYGVLGNTMAISMQRSGLLNATLGLIAKGETAPTTVTQSTTTNVFSDAITRFPQAIGRVERSGTPLGSVVSAQFTYSNSLDKTETIQASGEIEGADPGMSMLSGAIVVRFADNTLYNLAVAGTPVSLGFGWSFSVSSSFYVAVPRVFLPRTKRPVTGPNGIQASFNFQASKGTSPLCTVTLVNSTTGY